MIRKGWFTVSSGSIPMFQRINHVGVIVGDLEEARRWLGEVFGLPLRRTADLPAGRIHGEFYGCGDVDIEVITIGDPEVRQRRLGNARASSTSRSKSAISAPCSTAWRNWA